LLVEKEFVQKYHSFMGLILIFLLAVAGGVAAGVFSGRKFDRTGKSPILATIICGLVAGFISFLISGGLTLLALYLFQDKSDFQVLGFYLFLGGGLASFLATVIGVLCFLFLFKEQASDARSGSPISKTKILLISLLALHIPMPLIFAGLYLFRSIPSTPKTPQMANRSGCGISGNSPCDAKPTGVPAFFCQKESFCGHAKGAEFFSYNLKDQKKFCESMGMLSEMGCGHSGGCLPKAWCKLRLGKRDEFWVSDCVSPSAESSEEKRLQVWCGSRNGLLEVYK